MALPSWSNALRPIALRFTPAAMSYAWGNQTIGEAKRNLDLIRRSFDAIVPRSEIQYWLMIFLMLAVSVLLLATLLDTSPIF